MFRYLNKIIHNNSLRKVFGSTGGQAAIVLILVIAVVLIFYAVTLNFGYFSQVKGMVTVASNTSAGMLASYMASYAQSLSETQLGGKRRICKITGIFAAFLTLVIVVVVSVATWGAGTGAAILIGKILAVIGMALSTAMLALQVVVVQPMISASWNRIIQKTLSMGNQFTENALQSALSKVVTDGVSVPDIADMDGDGIWVASPSSPPYADEVSRYGVYYTHRLKDIKGGPVGKIKEFLAALDEFLHEGSDGWGIHDHMMPETCFGTAECFPCCLPGELKPEDCEDINWETACGAASPYGNQYPWVYDSTYENPNNAFHSFRELIGKDDEHQGFYKDIPPPPFDPNSTPQNQHVAGDEGFYLEDATNYYVLPYYTPDVPERHKGIYPFFHKMADWGVELSAVNPGVNPRECHWCDVGDSSCFLCSGTFNGPHPHPLEIPQLVLPLDPTALVYNTTYYVDGENLVAGDPPLWVDKVARPTNIIANPGVCAENSLYPTPVADGFWKPGEDQFCSPTWPYSDGCEKNTGSCADSTGNDGGTNNCACGEPGGTQPAEDFPDDALDNLYIGLSDFIIWAEEILAQSEENLNTLTSNLPVWYPDAARWIEPDGDPCFLCNLEKPPEGFLHVFLVEMTEMRDRILGWINNQNPDTGVEEGYVGDSCNEVWCIPLADDCAADPNAQDVQEDEFATFDSNANGVKGDIEDIVACLDHNINTDGGNAVRFQACFDACSACAADDNLCSLAINDVCGGTPTTYLPRSLIPGFDPNGDFIPVIDAASKGSCAETGPDTYLDFLQQSIPEATNQVAKFQKRKDFLKGRVAEARNIVDNVFNPAIKKFNAFLTGPAVRLINTRKDFNPSDSDQGLSYQAIYGWKDEDDPSGFPEGKWHIVKVEARTLDLCDNACGSDQLSPDLEWPKVKTYKKNWGMRRCYELENEQGSVKFRTTRYDEERDSGFLRFPNGVPIWNFRTTHPKRPQGSSPSPDRLEGDCENLFIQTFDDGTSTNKIYDGAFIMSKLEGSNNENCWNLAHELLARGVVTETCAKYEWMGVDKDGKGGRMDFKFVKCKPF